MTKDQPNNEAADTAVNDKENLELEKQTHAKEVSRGPGAPDGFASLVEERIHKRSAGRFFGKKTWSERLPLLWIAAVLFVVAGLLFWAQRSSPTGTLSPVKAEDTKAD